MTTEDSNLRTTELTETNPLTIKPPLSVEKGRAEGASIPPLPLGEGGGEGGSRPSVLSTLETQRYLLAGLAALVLLGLPVWLQANNLPHPLHILIMVCLYATLAQAWNITGGFAGQVSLGNAVFFGIGAYTTTLLTMRLGLSPWLGIPLGMLLAVLLSLCIGIPVFRLGGHYFAIATIAVGEIVQTIFINWKDVGGASGLNQPILPQSWINFQFHDTKLPYYYIALGMCVLAFLTAWGVERSRLGYYFRALKGDPLAARSLGIDIGRYKLIALGFSAALTALGGAFYAQYILFIDPESVLPLGLSILICLVAVLGGVNTLWGPLLGAMVLIPLSESTRVYLAELGGGGRALDLMIYGLLIVLIAIFQPGGLMALLQRLGTSHRFVGQTLNEQSPEPRDAGRETRGASEASG